jgi:hypothetical protein
LKRGPATSRKFNTFDHRTAVRQKLGLNFRTDAQLSINPFVATGFLQHLIVFDRDTSQISHKLGMAAMHIGPDEFPCEIKDIQTSARTSARHDGGGEHASPWKQTLDQSIHVEQLAFLGAETGSMARLEAGESAQQLLAIVSRNSLQLIAPEPAVGLKRHQQGSIDCEQPRCHHWNEFQKAVQIGEAPQGKAQRHQKVLISPLFAAETVEQLTQ